MNRVNRIRRPATIAELDQAHAEALEMLREARGGFVVVTFADDQRRSIVCPAPDAEADLADDLEQLALAILEWSVRWRDEVAS